MKIKYRFEGKFSELFPKSFAFIKGFMLAKYAWPRDFPIPDLTVVVFVNEEDRAVRGNAVAIYHFPSGKMIIYAKNMLYGITGEIMNLPNLMNKLFSDKRLLCKYFDGQERFRTVLIHEFQHFLQDFLGKKFMGKTVKLKISLPKEAFRRGFKEIALGYLKNKIHKNPKIEEIEQESAELNDSINSVNDLLVRQYHFNKMELKYLFDPMELEARITQMVQAILEGHKPGYYLGTDLFDSDIISRDLDNLTSAIPLLKMELDGKSFRERHLIKKHLKKMKMLIWKYKEHIRVLTASIKEAQTIASEIKSLMVNG